ncbi:unnamed protein product [Toxocara canis]|uniref:CNH domain-containing protein n=1 Tax=Toxocara canis TaxID=6265 RepID=A0A183V7U5_TOXCA|nr:unnamed protein product [Toxocara canis]
MSFSSSSLISFANFEWRKAGSSTKASKRAVGSPVVQFIRSDRTLPMTWPILVANSKIPVHTLTPVGGEKESSKRTVERVEYNAEEQFLLAMLGPQKDRHVRLILTAALDGRDLKWIKVAETKGCHLMAMGAGSSWDPCHYFCDAVKKTVLVCQIDRCEKRHRKLRDMAMPGQPQTMSIIRGKLCVGYPPALVNFEDASLQFLSQTLYDAQLIVNEFLLVFCRLGIYVDAHGRRCRSQELMFPSEPSSAGFICIMPHLCVYSEQQIDVFNVSSAEWVQTINLKKAFPLAQDGLLTMCIVNDLRHAVFLSDILSDTSFLLCGHYAGERRSQLPISGPSDFVHIVHMVPGAGLELQNLIDLKHRLVAVQLTKFVAFTFFSECS